MRPMSRGMAAPGTSGGAPGTAMRPGSGIGRKPPGTARLRTGIAPSGAGTQAAQGVAISANVSVLDRPVTGQGVMGMKMKGLGTGRLVEDNQYWVGLLRAKITEVQNETRKLRTEVDQQSRDSSSYQQIEKKYENLVKEKERLEGQLADYNLAMDKVRTYVSPDDVRGTAAQLAEKNRKTGQEVDRLFKTRRQKEEDTHKAEEQIEAQYRAMENRINELEPGKLRAYRDLMSKQREYQERVAHDENRLGDINEKIKQYEVDEKTNAFRKEYSQLEKQCRSLRRDAEALTEELNICGLDPKEAHLRYVDRVNGFKNNTKNLEDRVGATKNEINELKRSLETMSTSNAELDPDSMSKYEMLVKREGEMTQFLERYLDTREQILQDQQGVRDVVVALLEHIGRGIDEGSQLPVDDMDEAKNFKEKNIATAQRTMEGLKAEKNKRERDLQMLKNSEPKLRKELESLKDRITTMQRDMREFQDVEGMRKKFEFTKKELEELKASYTKRKDSIKQQVMGASAEYEQLKKALNAHETAREMDDMEKRLRHNERNIFELRELVESKGRESDYLGLKSSCVKMMETLNLMNVRKSGGGK